ncbi:hypothetical protein RB595_007361 [Gaeumannomyces hyphopodioides]
MVTKSKLKLALAAEKGIDLRKKKEQRRIKAIHKEKEKRKPTSKGRPTPAPASDEDEEDWEDEAEEGSDDDEDEEEDEVNLGNLEDSDSESESEVEMEEKISRPKAKAPAAAAQKTKADGKKAKAAAKAAADDDDGDDDDDDGEEEEDRDIAMSDLEDLDEEEKSDLIPHQRLTINNTTALLASLARIALPTAPGAAPFSSHMCVVSAGPATESEIPDVADDLARELALYKQCLDAARRGRGLLRAEGVAFSRPVDYFAEMVKPDEHMEKVKAKLVEDATAKKAAAEARKLRDLKKFGKQVQVAKLQERAKAKKDTLEKIQSLKRKRQESSAALPEREADLFDVGVDNELKQHKSAGAANGKKGAGAGGRGEPGRKRQKKNDKYGFGGKKKFSKSGDAISSGDLSGFSAKKMKGKSAPRPGKSKRLARASKR